MNGTNRKYGNKVEIRGRIVLHKKTKNLLFYCMEGVTSPDQDNEFEQQGYYTVVRNASFDSFSRYCDHLRTSGVLEEGKSGLQMDIAPEMLTDMLGELTVEQLLSPLDISTAKKSKKATGFIGRLMISHTAKTPFAEWLFSRKITRLMLLLILFSLAASTTIVAMVLIFNTTPVKAFAVWVLMFLVGTFVQWMEKQINII